MTGTALRSRSLFEVDADGLAKLIDHRKAHAVYELVANALDTNATTVAVSLYQSDDEHARVIVTDDDADGFADLRDAYTLFAESRRKQDPATRGRFDMGEKVVICLCDRASVMSTSGTVSFDERGRHHSDRRTLAGSTFEGELRFTEEDTAAALELLQRLIVPEGVTVVVNDVEVPRREPVASFERLLVTVLGSNLRRTERRATVTLYEPLPGHPATLYELGIPVVATGDRYDYDVSQKVPLSMERDNVQPAYLRHLRVHVLGEVASRLTPEEAQAPWVSEALAQPDISPEAVTAVVAARFGDKRVIADPSDPEGTKLAMAMGYTVIPAGAFTREQWANVRSASAALPAGRVTPSPRDGLGSLPRTYLDPERFDAPTRAVVAYSRHVGQLLLGFEPRVELVSEVTSPFAASYGGRTLTLNRGRLGRRWFDAVGPHTDAILLHEFAHERAHDHLDARFADEVARLAGTLVDTLLANPRALAPWRTPGAAQ